MPFLYSSTRFLQNVFLWSIFLTSSVYAFQPVAMLVHKAILVSTGTTTTTTAAAAAAAAPFPFLATMVLAEVVDDYEYGAVDAPIGIAFIGGVLAILTATLPFFLQSGEKAFEEIKDRDAATFGKRNDILKKRK